jgi:hypothetical protein
MFRIHGIRYFVGLSDPLFFILIWFRFRLGPLESACIE